MMPRAQPDALDLRRCRALTAAIAALDHKPTTEAELKEWETCILEGDADTDAILAQRARLISEVRRLREALEHYGSEALWGYQSGDSAEPWKDTFTPIRADLRGAPGYKLARLALGWQYPPPEPCSNPKCDGIADDHPRCYKDGYWLDDGSEM